MPKIIPNQNDVIAPHKGDAYRFNKHPGNIFFNKLVEGNADLYAAGNSKEKKRIRAMIRDVIQEKGGRFLIEQANGNYELMTQMQATSKVRHACDRAARRISLKKASPIQPKNLINKGSSDYKLSRSKYSLLHATTTESFNPSMFRW